MTATSSTRRKPARDVVVGDVARIRGRYRTILEVERLVVLRHPEATRIRLVATHRAGSVEDTFAPGAIIRTRPEARR